MIKPQNCPVCGDRIWIHETELNRHWFYIECKTLMCLRGPIGKTESEAIAVWNRIRVEKEE